MPDSFGSRYLDAWNSYDPAEVGRFMTDDVDFEDVTMGEQLHGRDQVEEFAARFSKTFSSDYQFTLVTEFSSDDTFSAEWVVTGTHGHDSEMLPASGKPFTIRGATIARLRDGLIVYNRDYWDMATFLREIGVLPGT